MPAAEPPDPRDIDGFAVREAQDTVLRTDHAGPVSGVLYLLTAGSP